MLIKNSRKERFVMFQLQCNIYQLNYETAFSFLIQKITQAERGSTYVMVVNDE